MPLQLGHKEQDQGDDNKVDYYLDGLQCPFVHFSEGKLIRPTVPEERIYGNLKLDHLSRHPGHFLFKGKSYFVTVRLPFVLFKGFKC